MTDEEIMEKLSMFPTFYIILKLLTPLVPFGSDEF